MRAFDETSPADSALVETSSPWTPLGLTAIELPAGDRYRLEAELFGDRTTIVGVTEPGVLHRATWLVEELVAGETREIHGSLPEVVPRLAPPERRAELLLLGWDSIPSAIGYRLREVPASGDAREFAVSSRDTALALPPARSLTPPPVGRVRYRVRAEFEGGAVSAYSESVGVTVLGPTRPSAVTDLRAVTVTDAIAVLAWTAPGDDGGIGQAATYDLRTSADPIDATSFAFATSVDGLGSPAPAGGMDGFVLEALEPETRYYVALVARDDLGLESDVSNVLELTTSAPVDHQPPSAVEDLTAQAISETSVRLRWSASGDDGRIGRAASYDLRSSTSLLDAGSFPAAVQVTGVALPDSSGAAEEFVVADLLRETAYSFALVVRDEAGNASGISNVTTARTLDRTPPRAVTDLRIRARRVDGFELSFTAPGDDGAVGIPAAYDVRSSLAPILDETSWQEAIPAPGPFPILEGGRPHTISVLGLEPGTLYYLALRARDEGGNESSLSNVVQGETR